jgi:hypothetical protein
MKKLNHVVKGLDPVADAFAGTVYTDIINMKNFDHAQFLIHKGVGATGTSTITLEACDDVSGSNVSAVPFVYQVSTTGDTFGAINKAASTGFVTTAGSSQVYKVDVDVEALLASGYSYIRLKAVEVVDSPVLGGVIVVLTEARFEQEIADSAIV